VRLGRILRAVEPLTPRAQSGGDAGAVWLARFAVDVEPLVGAILAQPGAPLAREAAPRVDKWCLIHRDARSHELALGWVAPPIAAELRQRRKRVRGATSRLCARLDIALVDE
jgi:hypothetical protein